MQMPGFHCLEPGPRRRRAQLIEDDVVTQAGSHDNKYIPDQKRRDSRRGRATGLQ